MKNTYQKITTEITTSHELVLSTIPALVEIDPSGSVTIVAAQLSELGDTGFTIAGVVKTQGKEYDFTVFYTPETTSFKARLITDGFIPLAEKYYPAPARIADHFYSKHVDMFADVTINDIIVTGDQNSTNTTIAMTMIFGSECLLMQRYYHIMPDIGIPVQFSGPLKDGQYTITGPYVKNGLTLPLLSVIPVNKAWLTITSHTWDYYDFSKNDATMSVVDWTGNIPLEIGRMKDIQVTYRVYDHGQRFQVLSQFGKNGLSINDMYALITQLAGKEETYPLPEWFILKDLSLRSLQFTLQKEVAKEPVWPTFGTSVFVGVGVDIALKLPDIPIPFFEFDDGGGATVSLYTQWDMMDVGGSLSMAARFESHWRGYALNLQLLIPDLYFEGRLKLEDPNDLNNKPLSIFPGFTNLVVDEIYVAGSIPEIAYSLRFRLVNKNSITVNEQIQIGKKAFTINSLEAHAFYNPEGFGMGFDLYFDLYGASFYVAGTYEHVAKQSALLLKGGIVKEISLVTLLNDIFSTTFNASDFDITITQLGLLYNITLNDADSFSNSSVNEFRFTGGIRFDWESIGITLDALADIHYQKAKEQWDLYIKAGFTWAKFYASASCKLINQSATMQFDEAVFHIRFMDMSLEATVKNKSITVELKNINLGILLEELINTLIPGAQWYIPWPFKILKQITLNKITLELEDKDGQYIFKARYDIGLKILFFTIDSLELVYNGNAEEDEKFLITLNISGAFTNSHTLGTSADKQEFDILNGIYQLLPGLAKTVVNFRYLAIGQHIEVEIPPRFDEKSVETIINSIKTAIKENSIPIVDEKNNWIVALQLTVLKSIHIDLLLCDPGFYGVKFEITEGSSITAQLKGLMFCILYGKVSETVGVFKAYLTLPEIFKTIQLEFIDIYLGDIGLALYTDGHFYIDCGFPHKGDFKKAFGINVLAIIGKGGFYLAVLTGDSSDKVPAVTKGHFETVLELGLGVALGIGKSINTGVLNAEAFIQIEAIFEGVFALYIDTKHDESAYYTMAAIIGISAVAKAELDAQILKISISASAAIKLPLTLERYRKCHIAIELVLKLNASAKVLFIKINFTFTWDIHLGLDIGKNSLAPWEDTSHLLPNTDEVSRITLNWNDDKIFIEIKQVRAFVTPYFSLDNQASLQYKTAFTVFLTGYQNNTLEHLDYSSTVAETSIAIIVEAFLTRALKATGKETLSYTDIQALIAELSDKSTYHTGFSMTQLNTFFENNMQLILIKGTMDENITSSVDIHAIPFTLPPLLKLHWQIPNGEKESFDLSTYSPVTEQFFNDIEEYYNDLRIENKQLDATNQTEESAATALFRDYFYTLTKAAVAQAESIFPKDVHLSIQEIVQRVLPHDDDTILDNISGSVSRSIFGGIRIPVNNNTQSMFTFTGQQYTSIMPAEHDVHYFEMENMQKQTWLTLHNEATASDIGSKKLLIDMGTPSKSLGWNLAKNDMQYPQDSFDFPYTVQLCEYYSEEIRTIPLKTPVAIIESAYAYYECEEIIATDYYITGISETTTSTQLASHGIQPEQGDLLYITLAKVAENIFSLCPLGYKNIEQLYRIKDTISSTTLHREANPIDEQGTGLLPLDSAFIYRSNLSLETEKPVTNTNATSASTTKNSANLATEPDTFIALLRDAALVNSKGYFIHCAVPDHALEDGQVTLVIWLAHDANAKWTKRANQDGKIPVVVTNEKNYLQKYEPGVFEFKIEAEEPQTDIREFFQMLGFYIQQSDTFRQSNESIPLIPDENWVYSQIVYGHKFAAGSAENPYNGIKKDSKINLEFFAIDLLGNRTQNCASCSLNYGYTDPIISPSTYPQTKSTYTVSQQTKGSLVFTISFEFQEQENNKEDDLKKAAQLAYYQLLQQDMTISVTILNKEYPLDKQPLLHYLELLYTTGKSASVLYTCEVPPPAGLYTEITVLFNLARDKAYIAPQLTDKPYEHIANLSVTLVMDEHAEKYIDEIAKDSEKGIFYYTPQIKPSLHDSDVSFWSLPPLSTKLVSLSDVEVLNASGQTTTTSFVNIDMEEWADVILKDFENYIAPESKYVTDSAVLEDLLAIKQNLATNIAEFTTHTLHSKANSAHRQRAVDCHKEYLLKNLYLGRKVSAVSVIDTGIEIQQGYNLLGYIKQGKDTDTEVTVAGQKIKHDALLAFVITTENTNVQKEIALNFQYIVSDWEKENKERPSYYSLLNTVSMDISQTIPIPYKRYPNDPVLPLHYYFQHKNSQWHEWDYTMELTHECAAQDSIFMKILLAKPAVSRKNAPQKTLAEGFAQYIYLRHAILADQIDNTLFIHILNNIATLWKTPALFSDSIVPSESVAFYINNTTLHLGITNKDFHTPAIQIYATDNTWHDVQFVRTDTSKKYYSHEYMLPDVELSRPYTLRFTFSGFDIRKHQYVESQISISRNQNIDSINPDFIYKTSWFKYYEELFPITSHSTPLSHGSFTVDTFIKTLENYSKDFESFSLECSCIRIIPTTKNHSPVYSSLPILMVPFIQTANHQLEDVYNTIDMWIKNNISSENNKHIIIECYLSLITSNRVVAEIVEIQFEVIL